MNNSTNLIRQISPTFIKDGLVTSQAFTPTRKDDKKLSVYDGDQFSAEESWKHFTKTTKCKSVGVLVVTVSECISLCLNVAPDNNAFQGHVLIDFSKYSNNQMKKKARVLVELAVERDWQYIDKEYHETLSSPSNMNN